MKAIVRYIRNDTVDRLEVVAPVISVQTWDGGRAMIFCYDKNNNKTRSILITRSDTIDIDHLYEGDR